MRDDRITESGIRQIGQHCRLNRGHHLAGFGPDHREAEDPVVPADKDFHESQFLIRRMGSQHGLRRQLGDASRNPLTLRIMLA